MQTHQHHCCEREIWMQFFYANQSLEIKEFDVYQNTTGRYFSAPGQLTTYRLVINSIENQGFVYTSYIGRDETWQAYTRNKRSSVIYLLEEIHNGHFQLIIPSDNFLQLTKTTVITFPMIRTIWDIL